MFEHRWGARDCLFSISADIGTGTLQGYALMGTGFLSWGQSGWGVASTTHLHLGPRLTVSGAILLLPPSFQTFYVTGMCLTLILRRSRTGTVWFYTYTSNKRAARPKLYTKSLTRDLKRMYSRFTLVRITINL